jgi:hypothetical protein
LLGVSSDAKTIPSVTPAASLAIEGPTAAPLTRFKLVVYVLITEKSDSRTVTILLGIPYVTAYRYRPSVDRTEFGYAPTATEPALSSALASCTEARKEKNPRRSAAAIVRESLVIWIRRSINSCAGWR